MARFLASLLQQQRAVLVRQAGRHFPHRCVNLFIAMSHLRRASSSCCANLRPISRFASSRGPRSVLEVLPCTSIKLYGVQSCPHDHPHFARGTGCTHRTRPRTHSPAAAVRHMYPYFWGSRIRWLRGTSGSTILLLKLTPKTTDDLTGRALTW